MSEATICRDVQAILPLRKACRECGTLPSRGEYDERRVRMDRRDARAMLREYGYAD